MRVAALGESTPMILRVQCDPCNAPSGLNEIINLYDQSPAYRLLPGAAENYPFCLVRSAVEVERSTLRPEWLRSQLVLIPSVEGLGVIVFLASSARLLFGVGPRLRIFDIKRQVRPPIALRRPAFLGGLTGAPRESGC